MKLPIDPPLPPMLAKLTRDMPKEGDWLFEPKWDGFRAIVFRDRDELFLQSRDSRPLDRYFPELCQALLAQLPERCVVDGEIVIVGERGLDFETLQLRLHPAESRINKLAAAHPTSFIAFDLLAIGDRDLRQETQVTRREALEEALSTVSGQVMVTPVTRSREQARRWFDTLEGAGIEGLIAKPGDLTYQPKKRAMLKIKHVRTADCVVGGFRWHKNGPGELIGSLLLGLYDDDGRLQNVGITSSFKMDYRRQLAKELEPLTEGAAEDHPWQWGHASEEPQKTRTPGGMSRWSQGKDLSWVPLRIERVVEVKFDYMQSGRFRHAASFVRWREDKHPNECRFDQIEEPAAVDLRELLDHSEPMA